MTKKIGKYKVGKHETDLWYGDEAQAGTALSFGSAACGTLTNTARISASAGVIASKVTSVENVTGTQDLSSINSDHKVFINDALSASIQLPQATSDNVGMKIECFVKSAGVTGSIGFTGSGDTTIAAGGITVYSTTADKASSIAVPANVKKINLNSLATNFCGGLEGSTYKFVYQAADTVFLDAVALGTGNVVMDFACTGSAGLIGADDII